MSEPTPTAPTARAATDEQILARFVGGDREALGVLAHRYERDLLGLAMGMLGGRRDLAFDAVQETWMRVIRYGDSFDGRATFRTWVYRILINRVRDLVRGAQGTGVREYRVPGAAQVASAAEVAERNGTLAAAVGALPGPKRDVILLCYHAQMTHAQAAEILRIPVGTLKSRLSAALSELRRQLQAGDER